MNTKELRIGNYFQWKSTGRIDVVSHLEVSYVNRVRVDDVKPIPLTKKWMKDFGFKLTDVDYTSVQFYKNPKNAKPNRIIVFTQLKHWMTNSSLYGALYFENNHGHTKIKYVHQLQNLYFDLTGEELKK